VRLLKASTFYGTWGDVFAWSMVVAWVVAAWSAKRGAWKPEEKLQTNRDAALKRPPS